jgi:hypothetical protein
MQLCFCNQQGHHAIVQAAYVDHKGYTTLICGCMHVCIHALSPTLFV